MLFDSPAYILFLILVVAAYWRLKSHRSRNVMLLAASYFFYGWWDWRFLLLMAGSTLLDFLIAIHIGGAAEPRRRKALLILSLVVNFSILGFFKYFDFFIGSFSGLLQSAGVHHIPYALLQIVLPPGISFYTFQEVAYIVDVYHRKLEPADSFVEYALFISLFPHLIAGPIQRPSHLLPQVQAPRVWDSGKAFDGVMLILEGLFRKCVIADNCALIANAAFEHRFGGPNLFVTAIGTYAFAWQIYGDFSAYSNIARGSAQLLGFHFMVNFRQPYLAQSMRDFWRRWHISLSTWLRDYLYIPLGGSRRGEPRTYFNLLTTMLLGGLWHGANWTFVAWGGIHGAALGIERAMPAKVPDGFVRRWVRRTVVFHIVCFAWIFFRAGSIRAAVDMVASLTVWQWQPEYAAVLRFLAVFIVPLLLIDIQLEKTGGEYLLEARPLTWRFGTGIAMFLLLAFFSANQTNAFIYFQF